MFHEVVLVSHSGRVLLPFPSFCAKGVKFYCEVSCCEKRKEDHWRHLIALRLCGSSDFLAHEKFTWVDSCHMGMHAWGGGVQRIELSRGEKVTPEFENFTESANALPTSITHLPCSRFPTPCSCFLPQCCC